MADRQDLNTIVSDIHYHGKNAVQRDLVNLRDVMDRGDLQQYQQDLLRITIQLKALGDDPKSLGLPDLTLSNGIGDQQSAGSRTEAPSRKAGADTPQLTDSSMRSAQSDEPPAWLRDGIAKGQQWIPENVRKEGVDRAYQDRMSSLPPDVQSAVNKMNIPHWMVAMMPAPDAKSANDTYGNIKAVADMVPPPGTKPMAERMQTLLAFAGAAKLPTPGDENGKSLGNEGCTAAISHYVLTPMKAEFPQLSDLPNEATTASYSGTLENLLRNYSRKHPDLLKLSTKPIDKFGVDDIHPGSLTIGHKAGGTHCFGWSQVPPAWTTSGNPNNWRPGEYIAIGNTGLVEFGAPHMSLAQDYLSPYPDRRDMILPTGGTLHGALNSHHGGDFNSVFTNPYYHPDSQFVTFSFQG